MWPNTDRRDAEMPPILLGDEIHCHLEGTIKRRWPVVGTCQPQRVVVNLRTVDRVRAGIRNSLNPTSTSSGNLEQCDASQHIHLAPSEGILLTVGSEHRCEM